MTCVERPRAKPNGNSTDAVRTQVPGATSSRYARTRLGPTPRTATPAVLESDATFKLRRLVRQGSFRHVRNARGTQLTAGEKATGRAARLGKGPARNAFGTTFTMIELLQAASGAFRLPPDTTGCEVTGLLTWTSRCTSRRDRRLLRG